MVELLPIIKQKTIQRFTASQYDFTLILSKDLKEASIYLWYGNYGINITDILKRSIEVQINEYRFNIDNWIEPLTLCTFYTMKNIDNLVDLLEKTCKKYLENKKVLLSFSGGKDSTTSLIVLNKLRDRINFKLIACYTYIPFIENIQNLRYIEKISNKFDIRLEIIKPSRKIVLKYLKKYGLPYRRFRWCTYLKVRPLREFMKKNNIEIYAIGDRATECEKRWERLKNYILNLKFITKREFRPIYTLTILDVIKTCREFNVVNPQYLEGFSRVSCTFCPYKTLPELYLERESNVEDYGLIESVLRYEYEKWYKDKDIRYEDFVRDHLWRFVPNIAKMFMKVREYFLSLVNFDNVDKIDLERFKEYYRSIWIEELPSLESISFEKLLNRIVRLNVRDVITQSRTCRETLKSCCSDVVVDKGPP